MTTISPAFFLCASLFPSKPARVGVAAVLSSFAFCTLFLLLLAAPCRSASAGNNGGAALYNTSFTKGFIPKGPGVSVVEVSGQPFDKAFRVAISAAPSRSDEVILEGPKTREVGLGLLKLSFALRSFTSGTQASTARVRVRLATSVSGTVLLNREVSASELWGQKEFQVSVKWPKPGDTIRCQFRFAGSTQPFEVGGLELLFFSEQQLGALAAQRPKIDRLPAAAPGKRWNLVWSDEFDGAKLDEAKWNIGEGKRNDVIRSRKAVSVDGQGHLAMSIFKEGSKIYDGWIDTKGKFEHRFGYYTARIKLQTSTGHWSAFWLQTSGTTNVDGGGRDGSEIDIMEKPGLSEVVNHAIHWDGYGKEHKSEGVRSVNPGITNGWHTFSLWWTEKFYVFYVDDYEVWRTDAGGVCQVPAELRLTDEASAKEGNWAGSVLSAKLPDTWQVDYVRVYDLVDEAKQPAMKDPANGK